MASTYLSRSKSTPTSDKIGTISFWIKRSNVATEQMVLVSGGGSDDSNIFFEASNSKLHVYDFQSSSYQFRYTTSRAFRDSSAWYNVVVSIDTTQATAGDRVKIYINGIQETVFDNQTNPSQNSTPLFLTNTYDFWIGSYRGSSGYFNGSMSHFHFIDGTAYDASAFGQFDANGVWTIKTSPSVTYGTNGFFILKDGNSVTDQSGNGNNFTVGGGTLTNTEDCPSNVFATLNPLYSQVHILSQGNLEYTSSTSDWDSSLSTIAVSSGKWYWETKLSSLDGSSFRFYIGICDERDGNLIAKNQVGQNPAGRVGDTIGLIPDGGSPDAVKNGSSTGSWSTNSVNDIIGIAVDCDNGAVYFSKNGTFMNSGNPTSGASKTGGITFTTGQTYLMGVTVYGDSSAQQQLNFGNGYFGTTAVASAGTNASGIGIFEYDVPTGYTALSTKGLNL